MRVYMSTRRPHVMSTVARLEEVNTRESPVSPLVLKHEHVSESPWVSHPVGLGQGPRICISIKSPDNDVGCGITRWEPLACSFTAAPLSWRSKRVHCKPPPTTQNWQAVPWHHLYTAQCITVEWNFKEAHHCFLHAVLLQMGVIADSINPLSFSLRLIFWSQL